MALQGLLLFGTNYVLVYMSETHISSGLTAVIFSSMVFWNILGMRLFYATPLRPLALAGASLGVLGVGLVFAPELTSFSAGGTGSWNVTRGSPPARFFSCDRYLPPSAAGTR